MEVRLPDEIPAAGLNRTARRAAAREQSAGTRAPVNLDGVHFMKNKPLRDSIMRASASNTFRVEIQRGVNNWETVARIPVQLESVAQPPAQVNAPA